MDIVQTGWREMGMDLQLCTVALGDLQLHQMERIRNVFFVSSTVKNALCVLMGRSFGRPGLCCVVMCDV